VPNASARPAVREESRQREQEPEEHERKSEHTICNGGS
jgi:hypothetical protein